MSSDFTTQIVTALQELGESTTEALPALEMLFFEEPLHLELSKMPLGSSLLHESLPITP